MSEMEDRATSIPLIQYWDTEEVPDPIAELIDTFSEHNPDRRHLVFSESSAEQLISTHFSAREVAAFRTCAVPAMQADYFRYCAVHALGGIYVDADIKCTSSLRPLARQGDFNKVFQRFTNMDGRPRPFPSIVNGFFIFNSPNHPLLRLTLDIATANIENRVVEDVWATTGPGILTALHLLHSADSVDAFIKSCRGYRVELTAKTVCEVVGGPARAAEAFIGVDLGPVEELAPWLQIQGFPRPHMKSENHWLRWQASIFRSVGDS